MQKQHMRDGIADREFELAYYKAFDAQKNDCFQQDLQKAEANPALVYESWPG